MNNRKQPLPEKILRYLTEDETRRRAELLDELESLEETAYKRYCKSLEEKADRELSALGDSLPENEESFRKRLSQKLSDIVSQYGKFGFIIWDWEPPAIRDIISGQETVYEYQVETDSDFNCIVVSDQEKSYEWAQEVFDNFYSTNDLKNNIGLITDNEAADTVLYRMAREYIPVVYK